MRTWFKRLAIRAIRLAENKVNGEAGLVQSAQFQTRWTPVLTGSLHGFIGDIPVQDDGNGNLVDVSKCGLMTTVGSVNYLTGVCQVRERFLGIHQLPYRLAYYFDPVWVAEEDQDLQMG